MSRARRRWTLLVGLVVVGVLLPALLPVLTPPAAAHAWLVDAQPADRSALSAPPELVQLTFNEPVTLPSGGLRVFDRDARRVDTGPVDGLPPEVVAVALPADLPDGGYLVSYRIISADSHPVAGVTTFTVGDADPLEDALVAELFGGAGGSVTGVLGPLLRALGTLAVLVVAGSAAVAALAARTATQRASARRLGRRAAVAGVVVTLLAVPVQALAVGGGSGAGAGVLLQETLASSFGTATLVRLLGLAAVLLWWWRRPDPTGAALAGALAAASFALDGHQRSVEPVAVLIAADVVHLLGAAVWLGGLVLLLAVLWPAWRDPSQVAAADPELRATTAGLVVRFGTLALAAVLVVAGAGVVMARVLVVEPAALSGTTAGPSYAAKLALVAVVLGVAAMNRFRFVPAVRRAGAEVGAGWRRLTHAVAAEVVLLTLVLAVTGVLVSQPPPAVEAGFVGAYQTAAPLTDELTVDLVVDPNRAGRNTLHLYLLEPTGRPSDQVDALRLELTYRPEDIGPLPLELLAVGPGHWTGIIDDLALPGSWELRVVAGLDRFSEAETTLTIPVR